jgi:hypothetical protein
MIQLGGSLDVIIQAGVIRDYRRPLPLRVR